MKFQNFNFGLKGMTNWAHKNFRPRPEAPDVVQKAAVKSSGTAGGSTRIPCTEILPLWQDLRIRQLAFLSCANFIANAIGKCEFKTYENHEEVKKREYYLFNIEPNPNQNSTAFWHKVIYQLYQHNEALIVPVGGEGAKYWAVADSFEQPLEYPLKEQKYQGVVVGEVAYQKTFSEREVLRLRLNQKNIQPALKAISESWGQLLSAAQEKSQWQSGRHLKVHVAQMAQYTQEGSWEEDFTNMIKNQVKPFFQDKNSVLPEFDGYEYSDLSDGGGESTRDIKALADDIFTFTANAFGIPPVLLLGDVAGTADAFHRWLTCCIDPLCDQIQEEINRKHYGYEGFCKGNYVRVDTSGILHFDLFENAANVEKLIGSGAFTINDVRRAAGQAEIKEPWADEFFMTRNIATMEEAVRKVSAEGGETNETIL